MIIGVDAGYYATKTSEGIIFPSRISTQDSIYGESTKVKIDGKSYLVGEGNIEVELNKVNKELTRVCILSALAMSSSMMEFQVVTGLPIGLFKTQKEQLKEMLLQNRFVEIEYKGQKRPIMITNVEIFPQCLGAFYAYPYTELEHDYIIIDFGGRTVDMCLLEVINGKRKLTQYSTITEGTLSLYAKVIATVNSKYELTLNIEDGEKIIKKGLFIYGEKQDINFVKDIILEHLEKVLQELFLKYPVKTTKMLITGGGAYLFKSCFEKRVPGTTLIPNAQLANAIGFKKVGESLWLK